MSGLVKLAIYGGAAFLAYNYYTKRKAKRSIIDAAESTTANTNENKGLLEDAGMQELGEEGIALRGGFVESEGWDSDTLTVGI